MVVMTSRVVTTDGSALGNPGPAGWAWVCASGEWGSGNQATGTNNQMELRAILEALRHVGQDAESVLIRSDSRYAIDCLTKWVHGWRKRDWKTAGGGAVANRELIEEILLEMATRRIRFEWVRGHDGDPHNEQADAHARSAASRASRRDLGRWGSGKRPA
jgi:ribonuclease HI